MSYAPKTLTALGVYYTLHGGVNLGIVGDVGHTVGYHLGRDRIYGPMGQGADDYSVKHPRDRAGLSGGASAIDFGRLNGSLQELYAFSNWLVGECQDKRPGSADIREIIYSPDGTRVQRYSGIDGGIHTGPGNGDLSHRTHTHVSYFRDSEQRSKVQLVAPYLEGDTVAQANITSIVAKLLHVPKGAVLLELDGASKVADNAIDRVGVPSPYGRGSELRAGVRWLRREFAIDPDGSAGSDPRRTVLVWLAESDVVDVPAPEPPPATGPTVLTGDDGSEYRRA